MSLTVKVNTLTIVHKGSDGTAISVPDICKTPVGSSVVPIAYINTAFSKDLVKGSTTVFTDGKPVALKDSEFVTSIGDEPGTVGGITSGVNKGKAKFTNYSMDVFIEGRNAARLSDPMSNNGNAPNSSTTAELQANLGEENLDKLCEIFCKCNDLGKPPMAGGNIA